MSRACAQYGVMDTLTDNVAVGKAASDSDISVLAKLVKDMDRLGDLLERKGGTDDMQATFDTCASKRASLAEAATEKAAELCSDLAMAEVELGGSPKEVFTSFGDSRGPRRRSA